MPTYIILGNFTDQGIRNIKDSPKRETAFRNLCEKAGAQVKDTYRTMGRYDLAAIVDAPDDVTLNAIVYSLGSLGNVRTETLRAFTPRLSGHRASQRRSPLDAGKDRGMGRRDRALSAAGGPAWRDDEDGAGTINDSRTRRPGIMRGTGGMTNNPSW